MPKATIKMIIGLGVNFSALGISHYGWWQFSCHCLIARFLYWHLIRMEWIIKYLFFSLLTNFSFEYVLDCVEESALVLNRPPYNALKIGEAPSMVAVLVLLPTGVQIYRKWLALALGDSKRVSHIDLFLILPNWKKHRKGA